MGGTPILSSVKEKSKPKQQQNAIKNKYFLIEK